MNLKKVSNIAKRITNKMNKINNNIFTKAELKEFQEDIESIIINDKDEEIKLLKVAYYNDKQLKDMELFKIIKELEELYLILYKKK